MAGNAIAIVRHTPLAGATPGHLASKTLMTPPAEGVGNFYISEALADQALRKSLICKGMCQRAQNLLEVVVRAKSEHGSCFTK